MKKKQLLSLMATLSMLTASAQDGSLPMLEEGRIWNKLSLYLAYPGEGDRADPYWGAECYGVPTKHVIKGDTVIDGRAYKKIYHNNRKNPSCMRQEGSRVYMYNYLSKKTDTLLYDFSLKERDTITISEDNCLVVDKVDTVKVDGISRRRLKVKQYGEDWMSEFFVDIWVEGIGGFVSAPCFFSAWLTTGYPPVMTSCEQDGKCIFTEDDFYAPAWKDETVSVKAIMNLSTVTQSSVFYDLQGRRLSGKPGKGVYIENGKKRLVK